MRGRGYLLPGGMTGTSVFSCHRPEGLLRCSVRAGPRCGLPYIWGILGMRVSDDRVADCCYDLAGGSTPDAVEWELLQAVADLLRSVLTPFAASLAELHIDADDIAVGSAGPAVGDLLALAGRDPAGKDSWADVLAAYLCFQAVAAYRVANAVLHEPLLDIEPMALLTLARQISEVARTHTGVEVHPAAISGPRFVIDYGTGTVIGEDVHVGSDCCVLHDAVLGTRGIVDNTTGTWHPKGNGVQVGGFARVLGPITVGGRCRCRQSRARVGRRWCAQHRDRRPDGYESRRRAECGGAGWGALT